MDFQEQPVNGEAQEKVADIDVSTSDEEHGEASGEQSATERYEDAKIKVANARRSFYGVLASTVCIIIAVTVLLTYTLTSAIVRDKYTADLLAKQKEIDLLKKGDDHSQLSIISALLEQYSYYADEMSEEEMLTAALKAYVAATGDVYAAYYTNAEYASLGEVVEYAGIGAGTVQSTVNYNGAPCFGYTVSYFYQNSPAQIAGLKKGDFIYTIKHDGAFRTVQELGGFEKAIEYIRGEAGTKVELTVLRETNGALIPLTFTVTRAIIENPSVAYALRENDPSTARVSIRRFDLDTPGLFKETVNTLLGMGVRHFVFDVRDNPGGDLLSIKAVLSYFLEEGDLVLKSIDRNGNVAVSYVVEPMNYTDNYSACNVSAEEIGMYRDLDMVVLCNENTASAAEVFAATMRDYSLAKIVGQTTFGKGIMQMIFDLSTIGNYGGHLKLTTHAYVTKCGVTYHEIGVAPDEGLAVSLSGEALDYSMYDLPEALDTQLQTAFSQFTP
ncbi:MAG: hypothetical protein IJW16_06145 [Clostridia bacterium]|nr:hypothetical protein [Clostridia bacterium]